MKYIIPIFIFTIVLSGNCIAEECSKKGMYFDTKLNRCIKKASTIETAEKTSACAGLQGEEYTKCFNDNAREEVTKLEENEEIAKLDKSFSKNNGVKTMVPLAISLLTGYYLILNKDKLEGCKTTSLWMIFGASTANFLGEVSAQITYNTKTKDLEEKYTERMKAYENKNDKYKVLNQNQEIAFEYMAATEKARLSAEKVRRGTYVLSTALYGAAVVTAAVEAIQFANNPGTNACSLKKTTSINTSFEFLQSIEPEFSKYHYIKNINAKEIAEIVLRKLYHNIIPQAYAYDPIVNCKEDEVYDDKAKVCIPQMNNKEQPKLPANAIIAATGDTYFLPKKDASGKDYLEEFDLYTNKNLGTSNFNQQFIDNDGNLITLKDGVLKIDKGAGVRDLGEVIICASNSEGEERQFNPTTQICEVINKVKNTEVAKQHKSLMDRAVGNPIVRGVLATGLGTYSYILAKQAKENINTLEKRIAAIEKMKSDFHKSGGISSYTTCNMEEAQEGEAEECVSIRAKGFDKWRRSNYNMLGNMNYSPIKACINKQKKLDTFCKCKTQKASDGSKGNNCISIAGNFKLGALGSSSWANALATPTDYLLNGTFSGADLDTDDLTQKSFALGKQLDKMEKDPTYKKTINKIKSNADKMQDSQLKLFNKSFPNGLSSSGLSTAPLAAVPSSKESVIEEVKKQIAEAQKAKFKRGEGIKAATEKKNGLDFDWGSEGDSEAGIKIDDVASVMDKNYQIKGDIHKNSDQDIFKILSIRYQRSGLRRLFDTEGKSSFDKANNSQIHGQ